MTTVMHLHWRFAVGGAETHIFELALAQKKLGVTPIIVTKLCKNTKYLTAFRKNKISFYSVDEFSDVDDLIHLIKLHNVNLLHAHSSHIYQDALGLSKVTNTPLVITLHGLGAINRLGTADGAQLISVSRELYDKVKNLHPESSINIIENGINLTKHIPEQKNNEIPSIMYVGRVDSTKINGVYNLHDAISQLADQVKFTSISTLSNKRFNIKGSKLIKGVIDSSNLLNASDIVVGTGRAIMEGMASGNVGIVLGEFYDGPVTPEKVEKLRYANFSGRSSKKVPDTKTILEDLNIIIKYPTVLKELQKWSHEYAKKFFNVEDKAKEHLKIYSKHWVK